MDEWRPIAGHGEYEVSRGGHVRHATRQKALSPRPNPDGYLPIQLPVPGGKRRSALIHRLVAEAFIPNPDRKPEVHHVNGHRADNRAENLVWISRADNCKAITRRGQRHSRPVVELDHEGRVIGPLAPSAKAAAAALGVHPSTVSQCCRGRNKSIKGKQFAYSDAPPGGVDERWAAAPLGGGILVSDLGRVQTRRGPSFGGSSRGGYLVYAGYAVHRLVASAFLPPKPGSSIVNHMDGTKQNNRADNLEWVTAAENAQHAVRLGLIQRRSQPVRRVSATGEVMEFASVTEAAASVRSRPEAISRALGGGRTRHAGFRWERLPLPRPTASAISDDDPIWAELGL